MKKLEGNYSEVTEFNHETTIAIADFFDINFVQGDPEEQRQWFINLKLIAEQNLGLAHCIVHNQSARNTINIAQSKTGLDIFYKSYANNIGAYSFFKGFSKFQPDTVVLNGNQLTGTKFWASQLSTADFLVLSVKDQNATGFKSVKKVFLDLKQIPHSITKSKASPMGMNVAFPCDITLDTQIPPEWILESCPLYDKVHSFHFYGLIANYISCANSLVNQAQSLGVNIEYELKKIKLNLDISTMLWENSFLEIFDDVNTEQFTRLNTQYQFARKNLVDTTSLFLEVMNTGLCDLESPQSQKFRDALSMGSHLVNLYKHVNGSLIRF